MDFTVKKSPGGFFGNSKNFTEQFCITFVQCKNTDSVLCTAGMAKRHASWSNFYQHFGVVIFNLFNDRSSVIYM